MVAVDVERLVPRPRSAQKTRNLPFEPHPTQLLVGRNLGVTALDPHEDTALPSGFRRISHLTLLGTLYYCLGNIPESLDD